MSNLILGKFVFKNLYLFNTPISLNAGQRPHTIQVLSLYR